MSLFYTFPGGRLEQVILNVALVDDTELVIDVTVPENRRWLLLAVKMTNPDDVLRDVHINLFDVAALTNLLRIINYSALGAGTELQWPNSFTPIINATVFYAPIILEHPNTINLVWDAGGASTGGADADGLVLEYLEMEI